MNKKELFEQNGYVSVPKLFSVQEAAHLKLLIEKAAHLLLKKSRLDKDGLTFYSNLYRQSSAICDFLGDNRLVSLLNEISQNDLWLRWDQCVRKLPGGAVFPLHRDNVYSKLPTAHIQVWIAITEMNEENGSLQIVPGSHTIDSFDHKRSGQHWVAKNRNLPIKTILAKPGDAIVFSSRLLHATGLNKSQNERWSYVAEFLPLRYNDPSIKPPYWQYTQNGRKCCEWKESLAFDSNFENRDLVTDKQSWLDKKMGRPPKRKV